MGGVEPPLPTILPIGNRVNFYLRYPLKGMFLHFHKLIDHSLVLAAESNRSMYHN